MGDAATMTGTAKTHSSRPSPVLLTALVFAILISLGAAPVAAQPSTVIGTNVQKLANGVLTLMGFGLTPDRKSVV